MKRAVSVSLGSSSRDKRVVVHFKGQPISIERIGTDGDAEKARRLFADLDAEASGPTRVAHAAVAAVLRDTERAVQAYNAAEPEARGVLYQRVHAQAVAERAARRRLARVQRPLTRLTVALQETLAEARVAAVA